MGRRKGSKNGEITPLVDRFWNKVDICGIDDCWNWLASKRNGYGRIWSGEDKNLAAHRVSWELKHGKIPDGMKVLHVCDNPSCVNPRHLFLGTQTDNIYDMCEKGRQVAPRGENMWKSILTEDQVKEIRLLRKQEHYTYVKLAELFEVSKGCINHIINGRSWSWIK